MSSTCREYVLPHLGQQSRWITVRIRIENSELSFWNELLKRNGVCQRGTSLFLTEEPAALTRNWAVNSVLPLKLRPPAVGYRCSGPFRALN